MASTASRLALGTVQFGLSYGIANEVGQVAPDEGVAILSHARRHGIDTLDTAVAYGDSERRLGEAGVAGWRVVSKLPPVPSGCGDVAGWARQEVAGSLARLRVPRLEALLAHRAQDLAGAHAAILYHTMTELKREGKVLKIGASVYAPGDLETIVLRFPLDLVQAPLNIIDRRIAASGWLARLHDSGVEVHTRSAFLQGLLLMPNSVRPAAFQRWQPLWTAWDRWQAQSGQTAVRACLAFVLSHPEVDRVVVGVDSLRQLEDILTTDIEASMPPPDDLVSGDLDLIDPSRWRTS